MQANRNVRYELGRPLLRLAMLCGVLAAAMSPVLRAGEADRPGAPVEVEAYRGESYSEIVLSDGPVAYWRLNDPVEGVKALGEGSKLKGVMNGSVRLGTPGPRPAQDNTGHVAFGRENGAAEFDGGGYISIDGANSQLTFDAGESITIEAWVKPSQVNGQMYVIGKGRTYNEGFPGDNQNWGLRLTGGGGGGRLSFLFRSASEHPTAEQEHTDQWHRWTSDRGVWAGEWHHIAVTYTFGKPESIRGYINGRPTGGEWDMGGPTTSAPAVDDDDVWIGASMGGGSGFRGGIDEIAVYRAALSPERIADHYRYKSPPAVAPAPAPDDAVVVEFLEGVPNRRWEFTRLAPTQTYEQDTMAFAYAPRKYNAQGLIIDRSAPYMLRASTKVRLPAGEHRGLLRSLNGARLYVDGEVVATTDFNRLTDVFDEPVEPLPTTDVPAMPDIRQIPAAHSERFIEITSEGGEHVFMLEAFIGGPRQRFDVGELVVAIAGPDGRFRLLSPRSDEPTPLTDRAWRNYAARHQKLVRAVNTEERQRVGKAEAEYWARRHEMVREDLADEPLPPPPEVSDTSAVFNDIDRYINARLEKEGIEPAPLTNDYQFLRRVTLDIVGVVPTPAEIRAFFGDPPETRRERVIDRLLEDPRWADHWVGYWQDVLAENPPLINQALNNTGAFRWYLYEAMLDNRPVDRFATEMVMMEGSRDHGGPAGFEIASQNDAPMADKAYTLSQAFMGMNLACARCHDAPFHDFMQKDVFAMAAMLGREPQTVPASSSVPGTESQLRTMIIEVTLEPGAEIEPYWPFEGVIDGGVEDVPPLLVRDGDDPRARLAALLTWHRNERFAPVMANRLWRRYLGFGLLEPVGDWSDALSSHPKLLDYLARELMVSGYDLKHLARLILSSHTYQRRIVGTKAEPVNRFMHLFASPVRRRMRAEQVVDSLFDIAGKKFRSEPLTMDPHSNRAVGANNHLGYPRRSWQMSTLANERDRASLNLPMAQKIVQVLKAFGWRETRQTPLTVREKMPVVQQPAVLANGVVGRRITRLSDSSAFTEMALRAPSAEALVERLFLRILTRKPTAEESSLFSELLAEGFEDRIVADPPPLKFAPRRRNRITWRNHLGEGADEVRREEEKLIQKGDPPSVRLKDGWRRRAEDVVWTLINSPEFVIVP